jgi:hypothetical protein
MDWYDDIKKNNPELLPKNIKNKIYKELKNFAQTLNVTVINYNLKEKGVIGVGTGASMHHYNYYRFLLRIYDNDAVLPKKQPELKFSRKIRNYCRITSTIVKFENFFNYEANNSNLNNNLNIFNNSNVNYINMSEDSNNLNYLNVPIAIAEIV